MQNPPPNPFAPPPIPHPTDQGTSQAPLSDNTLGGLIPTNNKNALIAYYIGLFSLLPLLGLVMAPLAVWLGRKGLVFATQNPAVKGRTHAWVGIICGGFWTLVHYGSLALMLFAILASR
jgi:hypothetical protein